jgi:hypothetical protein
LAAKKKTETPLIQIAPLGVFRAYTVWEHELEKLEQGAPVSDLLTIGLCLLSAALTILVTLLSTSITGTTLTLFFCALLITGIIGAICTYLGWRGRISARELARQIRARMPAAPVVQQIMTDVVIGALPLRTTAPSGSSSAPLSPPPPPANP